MCPAKDHEAMFGLAKVGWYRPLTASWPARWLWSSVGCGAQLPVFCAGLHLQLTDRAVASLPVSRLSAGTGCGAVVLDSTAWNEAGCSSYDVGQQRPGAVL